MRASTHIEYDLIDSAASLPEDEQELLRLALEATANAYVPYSNFRVGCALRLEGGEVITGNNQENPAFPSSLCAERTALYYMGSLGKSDKLRKIAIRAVSTETEIHQPVTPCGACRQVMLEYERRAGKDIMVLMQGEEGNILKMNGIGKTLLPFGFDIEF